MNKIRKLAIVKTGEIHYNRNQKTSTLCGKCGKMETFSVFCAE
jgi:hypothetical protein